MSQLPYVNCPTLTGRFFLPPYLLLWPKPVLVDFSKRYITRPHLGLLRNKIST